MRSEGGDVRSSAYRPPYVFSPFSLIFPPKGILLASLFFPTASEQTTVLTVQYEHCEGQREREREGGRGGGKEGKEGG